MTANQWHLGKQFSCISYMWLVLLLWKLLWLCVVAPREHISAGCKKHSD